MRLATRNNAHRALTFRPDMELEASRSRYNSPQAFGRGEVPEWITLRVDLGGRLASAGPPPEPQKGRKHCETAQW